MMFPIFQSSCGNKHDRISVFPMLTITCSGCFLYLLFYLFPNFCDIYCPDNMSLTIAIFASNGHSALFFSYNECKKIRRGNKVLTLLNLGITFFDLFLSLIFLIKDCECHLHHMNHHVVITVNIHRKN